MSSVSGSGNGNRNDEVVRRNREDYQKNEAEMVKKHNREVRRMTEAHQAELERLRETHQQQMQNVQSRSRESITRRDRRYQQEIDNLKAVHRQQLQKLMSENEDKMRTHREAIAREQDLAKAANDHRVDDVKRNYTALLEEKDETFEQSLKDLREDQADAIARQREYLNRAHSKELEVVQKDRTEKVSDANLENRELRETTARRLKNQEVRHFNEKQRITSNHLQERERLQRDADKNSDILRDGFRDGLRVQRDKYEEAAARNREAQRQISERLESDVNGRVDTQIRRLEQKIQELKEVNVRDQLDNKRRAQMQIDNIEREYEKKLGNYKDQRDQAVEQFNERNAADIAKVRKENDDLLKESNRFYRERQQVENMKNRSAIASIATDNQSRLEQARQQAELRVDKVLENTGQREERLRENFDANLSVLRESNAQEKRELALDLMKERDEAIRRVKEQMNRNETRNNEKLVETISRYEKRIAELQDRTGREKRLSAEQQRRAVETLKRAHQTELDSTRAQYEEKLAKVNEQHREEMEKANRRHEARMDEVLQTLRKS